MRFIALFAILFSASGFARELVCLVEAPHFTPPIDGRVNLDKKPDPSDPSPGNTVAQSESIVRKPMVIDGKMGIVVLRLAATYYDKFLGNPKVSNINDRFPVLDIGAFFYETDATGVPSSSYSQIGVRFEGSPSLNVYGSSAGNYQVWAAGMGATLSCEVVE